MGNVCWYLVLLVQGFIVISQATLPESNEYSVDETCHRDDIDLVIGRTINEAVNWARRAAQRMESKEEAAQKLQKRYFNLLLAGPRGEEYDVKFKRVISVLVGNNQHRGISHLTENDDEEERDQTDYKIYCDDDVQEDRNRANRWHLKPDPPLPVKRRRSTPEYSPNKERPPLMELKRKGGPLLNYQQWEDIKNMIDMGPTAGCQDDQAALLTSSYIREPEGPESEDGAESEENPTEATITICNRAFERSRTLSHLGALNPFNDHDLTNTTELKNLVPEWKNKNDDDGQLPLFANLLSFDLMSQFLMFNPWSVRDPSYTLAHRFSGIPSQWQYVQEIAHQSGMFNSPNWAYFGLLAALADYGYQLSEVPDEERKGRLVKNSDIIRS